MTSEEQRICPSCAIVPSSRAAGFLTHLTCGGDCICDDHGHRDVLPVVEARIAYKKANDLP
jgi:hypothetical protein